MNNYIDIVFDGPPDHESGRFVEVEDSAGKSTKYGEWIERKDGNWVLRVPCETNDTLKARKQELRIVLGFFPMPKHGLGLRKYLGERLDRLAQQESKQ